LYVFRTGVAFLVLEVGPSGVAQAHQNAFEDFAELNARIGRVSPGGTERPIPELTFGNGAGERLRQLGERILKPLEDFGVKFAPRDERDAKVLAYARLTQQNGRAQSETWVDHREAETFTRLWRVATRSHAVRKVDLDLDSHKSVVKVFQNVATGVSMEGVATLAAASKGVYFIEHLSEDRVRHAYFAHYLLALHQRCALLLLVGKASQLPHISHRSLDLGQEAIRSIEQLRSAASEFNLRHRFSQVSTITPYRVLYEKFLEELRVKDLLDEFRDEVRDLDELKRVQDDVREKMLESRLNWIVLVLGMVGIAISLFGSNLPPWGPLSVTVYRSIAFFGPLLVVVLIPLILRAVWGGDRRR